MTSIESSSSKVPYDLRPRKQVERRMMAHVFQLLSEAGFPISTYCYAGFGAFFFVDFILFRRILGINDMLEFRLHCSMDRGGDMFNLSNALGYHEDENYKHDGAIANLVKIQMRNISQKCFSIFSDRFILSQKNR